MKTIDVKKLIEQKGLDVKEVSKQLFPNNKYPRLALNRVMMGDSFLDSNQISKLSLLADVTIEELFTFSGSNWKAISNGNTVEFRQDKYLAKLDTQSWITRIFHNETMFHEVIIHTGSIAISEYLKEINLLITKYEQDGKSKS